MEVLLSEKLGKAGSTGMVSSTKFIYFSEKRITLVSDRFVRLELKEHNFFFSNMGK
jgi:hypothetical protein